MRLTLNTDYSLRVLMYAAAKTDGALCTVQEIAQSFHISHTHLAKVVHRLAQLGYLETVRGRTGGMRLTRAPVDVRIGAVMRHIEKELGVLRCIDDPSHCGVTSSCTLRRIFIDATDAFLKVLAEYSLEDLLKPRAALAFLLDSPRPCADGAAAALQPEARVRPPQA